VDTDDRTEDGSGGGSASIIELPPVAPESPELPDLPDTAAV